MATGVATHYGLAVGEKLEVEDFIYILTPTDVPLLGTFNGTVEGPGGPQNSILSQDVTHAVKTEWLEETLITPRSTLNDPGPGLDASETDVTVTDAFRFQGGHIILVDAEYMSISSVDSTGLILTVVRGFNGSTAATHSNLADVVGVGTALAEGSDPEPARWVDRLNKFNLTQIFGPYKVEVSETEQVVAKYGVTNELDHQIANRMRELNVEIEQALIYGTRSDDANSKKRTMGGLTYYITTNVDSTTTALTEAKILDNQQFVYNNGSITDTLLMGGTQKRLISGFHSGEIRYAQEGRIRGQVVDWYEGDFGTAEIVLDRHVRRSDLFGLNRQYLEVDTLRPCTFEMLAKTGDADKGQIVCEKTFKVRNEKTMFRFSALT